jgi:multiple sugar transport system substrate-binding protein
VTPTDSWATGISPFSKHKDAAKKFLAYMTLDPAGATATTSNNIPVQNDAFQTYLNALADKSATYGQMAAIIKYALANTSVSRPMSIGYVDFESMMNKAFADIRNGSPAADRLKQAGSELDRALIKYRNR